jgi:adenylosuccinate synthase
LIKVKSYPVAKIWNTRSDSNEWLERCVLILDTLGSWSSKEFQAQFYKNLAKSFELETYIDHTDDSVEEVIELVDEWMADESDYDQETYPQIEAALNKNQLSI